MHVSNADTKAKSFNEVGVGGIEAYCCFNILTSGSFWTVYFLSDDFLLTLR